MRLWTQAIHMGKYVARSVVSAITGDECELDFAFMHFMHATHFFGFRTALLGLYNGQGLVENETEYLMRITPNDEFVKIVVYKNKVRGAILLYRDDCELTEVLENLICNEINIEEIKDFLLDPGVDIADYFD